MFRTQDDKVIITAPYNQDFIREVKRLGGRWDAFEKTWNVDKSFEAEVVELLKEVYGYGEEVIPYVIVRAVCGMNAHKSGVDAGGRVIAKAFGRDSGARVGDKVALLSGKIGSGGSMNNWRTIVDEGAVFKIMEVNQTLINKIREESDYFEIIEIGGEESRLEILKARKAKLLVELKEINGEIAEINGEENSELETFLDSL